MKLSSTERDAGCIVITIVGLILVLIILIIYGYVQGFAYQDIDQTIIICSEVIGDKSSFGK